MIEAKDILSIIPSVCIPLVIGWITYWIAKLQIRNAGVTQFRQQWINDLRESISHYIAKAEMISMLDLDDDDSYFEYFKDFSHTRSKIELMLNPEEDDHNEIIDILDAIGELAHDEDMDEDELHRKIDDEIEKLLAVTKRVLKREWNVVKKGK